MIGFIDTSLQSLVIIINYNKSQINLQPNPSSLTAEDSLHSRSTNDWLFYTPTPAIFRIRPSDNHFARTPRKT
jgi:hypothetical protein